MGRSHRFVIWARPRRSHLAVAAHARVHRDTRAARLSSCCWRVGLTPISRNGTAYAAPLAIRLESPTRRVGSGWRAMEQRLRRRFVVSNLRGAVHTQFASPSGESYIGAIAWSRALQRCALRTLSTAHSCARKSSHPGSCEAALFSGLYYPLESRA